MEPVGFDIYLKTYIVHGYVLLGQQSRFTAK